MMELSVAVGFRGMRFCFFFGGGGFIHPGRLTWNLQITHLERKMIFQTSMIMFHVNLPGCSSDDGGFPPYLLEYFGGCQSEHLEENLSVFRRKIR